MALHLHKQSTNLFFATILFLSSTAFAQNNNQLSFTENKGQVGDQYFKPRPDVLFTGGAGNSVFLLRKTGISYQLTRVDEWRERNNKFRKVVKEPVLASIYRLDINWLHANEQAKLVKESPLPGYSNYYNQLVPNGVSHVNSYQKIIYKSLYPGIDLHYYGKDGQLKYDFVVSPGSDYKQVQLDVSGATAMSITKNGEVIIETPLGTFEEGVPLVYQAGKELKAHWVLEGTTLGFAIEGYDRNKELIIDPLVRNWGTFYGGSGDDGISECVTDGSGNSYIVGQTASTSGNVIATVGTHMSSTGTPL